mmetsp:Transcript_28669/g.65028  ORF Transcript_28669/g.65028 Transcript_28669/m.65028 type:complete len:231 (+) Transcript_28669:104-796(+)
MTDRCSQTSTPEGLDFGEVSSELLGPAVDELARALPVKPNSHGNSDMLDLQWSFTAVERHGELRVKRPLREFPAVATVISAASAALGVSDLGLQSLNVICRRYRPGQRIAFHIDRPELFDEPIYGCVLATTSRSGLEFRHPGGQIFSLSESPGTVFRQMGDSRYVWSHGIDDVTAERLSVTWRWVQPEVFARHQQQGTFFEADPQDLVEIEVPPRPPPPQAKKAARWKKR